MQRDEVTGHDFHAIVSHLNEAACTIQSLEQNGKWKTNYTWETQDKVEKSTCLGTKHTWV